MYKKGQRAVSLILTLLLCTQLTAPGVLATASSLPTGASSSASDSLPPDSGSTSVSQESSDSVSVSDSGSDSESIPTSDSTPASDSLPPDESSSTSVSDSSGTSESTPPDSGSESESIPTSDSASDSDSLPPDESDSAAESEEPPAEDEAEAAPLQIVEISGDVRARVGKEVTFSVTVNRPENAAYQWQRLLLPEEADTALMSKEELQAEAEQTTYYLPVDGMTEAELLAMNPDATWPGKEMWDAAVAAAGGDTSVHIANGTPIVLEQPAPTWEDIDGATEATYTFTAQESDENARYRCIVREAATEHIKEENVADEPASASSDVVSAPNSEVSEAQAADSEPAEEAAESISAAGSEEAPEEASEEVQTEPLQLVTGEMCVVLQRISLFSARAGALNVTLDGGWLTGVERDMEYITAEAFERYGGNAADNPYWTKLAGGTRADGTTYIAVSLSTKDSKYRMPVLSAWYGKTVYVRRSGDSGRGVAVEIPAYTDVDFTTGKKTLYKKAISVLSVRVPETGMDFYSKYVDSIVNSATRELAGGKDTAIVYGTAPLTPNGGQYAVCFNTNPERYLQDAEGNYRFDSVMVGVNVYAEPDLSGKAAWALRDYMAEGYGVMTGHDMLYGYGGVTNANYVPDKNSTTTPYYELNTSNNGHWNMNWLMGANKLYTDASPYEAASLVLCGGSWIDKSTLYGDNYGNSVIRVKTFLQGDPETNPALRTPTNYPYSALKDGSGNEQPISIGSKFETRATHSNQQIAYGTVWLDFASNSLLESGCGQLVTDTRSGLTGTNNFYLTTNGNIALNQIGHRVTGQAAMYGELQMFANTLLYISQRQQCQVCQSEQGGNQEIHFVHRVSSAEQLAQLREQDKYWYTMPMDGCYILTSDILLPNDWTPIEGFYGHFHANGYSVALGANGAPLFANDSGILGEYTSGSLRGWNLGTSEAEGIDNIVNADGLRATGVARVSGFLGTLFGEDNAAWAGKTVIIDGTDGKQYACKTNADGKYVLSNLPCTGIMKAHVYDESGEVTRYGPIRVNVPAAFWDTDETTELYLLGFTPIPVENRTIYEAESTSFVEGGVYWPQEVTDITWEYKAVGSREWRALSDAPFTAKVNAPEFHDLGDDSYTTTSIELTDCPLWMDGYHFRAVFRNDVGGVSSTDMRTSAGKEGMLTVLPRPAYVEQAADKTVWANEDVEYTSYFDFWKTPADGLTIQWQYQESGNGRWMPVSSEKFTFTTTQATTDAERDPVLAPYRTQTTLHIENVSRFWSGYHFRAVYTYGDRVWASSDYDEPDYTGLLIVLQPEVRVTNPEAQSVHLTLGQSVSTETATFTSTVTYKPAGGKPDIEWNYNTPQDFTPRAWTQESAAALYPESGIKVKITNSEPVAVAGEENTWRITSTMTITNAPIEMDLNAVKYRFQCAAEAPGKIRAASTFAPLHILYPIDIKHNVPVITMNSDGSGTYMYPKLEVFAPEGVKLRTLILQFSSATVHSSDAIFYENLPAGTSVTGDRYAYTFHNAEGLTAEEWQVWMRANTSWKVYERNVDAYWYIDEDGISNSVYYNSDNGHYYELMSLSYRARIDTARNLAHARSFLGLTGYLCTITSASEQEAVRRLTQGQYGLLGGTQWSPITGQDNHRWVWIDGPEAGTAFYYQNSLGEFEFGGYPLNGMYNAWAPGEPYNGFGGGGTDTHVINYGSDCRWRSQGHENNIWVVEYGGYAGQTIARTEHSAWDIDAIGVGANNAIETQITAENVIYDGKPHGAVFTVTSETLTETDIEVLRDAGIVTYLYPDGSKSTDTPVHAGTYTATLTFPADVQSKYNPPLETVCIFTISPRGLLVYSTDNNKPYDGTVAGTIANAQFEPYNEGAGTGVVAGDAVALSSDTFAGRYSALHQTNGVEIPMTRTGELTLVENAHGDYYIMGETYTGQITPRPLHVHSRYLDEPDTPRNIKAYDGRTDAVIRDILLDGVVGDDTVRLASDAISGVYADAAAQETLTPDGKTQNERYLKLGECEITRTGDIALTDDPHGDYVIGSESYSGAIYRRTLEVLVPSYTSIYGEAPDYVFETLSQYTKAETGGKGKLQITPLMENDALTIDGEKSFFVFESIDEVDARTDVGIYEVTYAGLTQENYPVLENYVTLVIPGGVTVTPRTLTITVAGGYHKELGKKMPTFGVKYDGFVNGDTAKSALEGELVFETSCTQDSPVFYMPDGKTLRGYPVFADGLTCKENQNGMMNYELVWEPGDIKVYSVGLEVEKSADRQLAHVGDTVSYTITVTNKSVIPLQNVKVRDEHSGAGRIEAADTDTYRYLGDGAFLIYRLDRDASVTLRYTYKVMQRDEGTVLKNVAVAVIPGDPFDPVHPFDPNAPTDPEHSYPSNKVEVEVDVNPVGTIHLYAPQLPRATVQGQPIKPFPKTGLRIGEDGLLYNEESVEARIGEQPSYEMPETVKHEGKTWTLRDVSITRTDGLTGNETHTVIFEGLDSESVPETYTVENGAVCYTLKLADVTYESAVQKAIAVDYPMSIAQPNVPQTLEREEDGKLVRYTLDNLTRATPYTWRRVELKTRYDGDVGYHFYAGTVEIPYSEEKPVFKGHEQALLALLENSTRIRIIDSYWTDDAFTANKQGDKHRSGVYVAQVFAADWKAHYTVSTSSFTANALYTADGKCTTVAYSAVGVYERSSLISALLHFFKWIAASPIRATVAVGVLLILTGVIAILAVLANAKKRNKN